MHTSLLSKVRRLSLQSCILVYVLLSLCEIHDSARRYLSHSVLFNAAWTACWDFIRHGAYGGAVCTSFMGQKAKAATSGAAPFTLGIPILISSPLLCMLVYPGRYGMLASLCHACLRAA